MDWLVKYVYLVLTKNGFLTSQALLALYYGIGYCMSILALYWYFWYFGIG